MDKLIEYLLKEWSVIKQPPLSYAALDSRLR